MPTDPLTAGLQILNDAPGGNADVAAIVRALADDLDATHALKRHASRPLAEELLACLEAEEALAERILTPILERIARRVVLEQLRQVQAGPPIATAAQVDVLRKHGYDATGWSKADAGRVLDQLRRNGWKRATA